MQPTELAEVAKSFVPRIRKIARGLCRRLPATVDAEDLAQAGVVGMMGALKSYDPQRGDSVEGYVMRRIRGAILDELRALDPLSRDQRRDARAVQHAQRNLETQLGRAATEHEVADHAGVAIERLRRVRTLAQAIAPTSLDDSIREVADDRADDPVENLARGEIRTQLADAISRLSEREQLILQLYFVEELALKEIGNLLNVTESRVCQIQGAAVKKLHKMMTSR